MRRLVVIVLSGVVFGFLLPASATAQTQRLRWQLAPFCDVIDVTLTSVSTTQSTLVGASD